MRPPHGRDTISTSSASDATAGGARIKVSGLGKKYGELQVFRNIDLTLADREIVSLVGPSGCGKTTLLRCIDGLISVNEGQVLIEGRQIASPIEGVAMVFQHFGLFPWKTVYQNVAYGLKLAGTPTKQIRDAVPDVITLVGLGGFENHYPSQLSGGMQQRCGLARALALKPRVLLMDEPFAAVDAQTREILQFELLRIWEMQPMTMVFVTHSIEEAVLMGDRVVILKGRPSNVHEIIDVGLPRPRTRETVLNPRFGELREHVWSMLMDEARKAEFEVATS